MVFTFNMIGPIPLAFAIVSEETYDNWRWFLEDLKQAIDTRRKLLFVSERNHNILEGAKNIFPECKHGYCYKHLTANLKDKFRGASRLLREKVLKQFVDCVYASTKDEFDRCFAMLLVTGGQRFSNFIVDLPREK